MRTLIILKAIIFKDHVIVLHDVQMDTFSIAWFNVEIISQINWNWKQYMVFSHTFSKWKVIYYIQHCSFLREHPLACKILIIHDNMIQLTIIDSIFDRTVVVHLTLIECNYGWYKLSLEIPLFYWFQQQNKTNNELRKRKKNDWMAWWWMVRN